MEKAKDIVFSKSNKKIFIISLFLFVMMLMIIFCVRSVSAADDYSISLSVPDNDDSTSLSSSLRIVLLLTVLSLAPSILIMMTSFTRIVIVLHFVRSAIGTQNTPPNQILIGLSLFLTLFVMSPVLAKVNDNAIVPLNEGKITAEEAYTAGMEPIREFMFNETRTKDLSLFVEIYNNGNDEDLVINTVEDIPSRVLIPSFIISELRTAFIIGFIIYIPFIIIDMVVASTLMSMGMMMLPPTVISMPFKILLFVLADGWNLVIGNLVKTFY